MGKIIRRVLCLLLLPLFMFVQTAVSQTPDELTGMQEPEVPDSLSGWDLSWRAGLNMSQAAYSNWSTGGINSYNLNSSSRVQIMYKKDRFAYDFQIRTRYGQARIQDEGRRKTDDRIELRNRFLYDISQEETDFKLFGNVTFETQYSEGFDYGGGDEGEDILISDFLSPAYFDQATGLAYVPDPSFSIQAGMGLRQTFVRDTTLSERYGLNPGQTFRMESGVSFGIVYETEAMEDIQYTGELETFTNIIRSMRNTNINFSNQLVGKVNDIVDVLLQVAVVYNSDFSDQLQFAQSFSAGVSINIY